MVPFREIEAPDLEALRAGGSLHLVDVRTEAEVARGVIPGAVHIPLHLIPYRLEELPRDLPMVIYCQSGGRSAQACAFLAAKGFGNTHNLRGGILGWARAGLPLATGT